MVYDVADSGFVLLSFLQLLPQQLGQGIFTGIEDDLVFRLGKRCPALVLSRRLVALLGRRRLAKVVRVAFLAL